MIPGVAGGFSARCAALGAIVLVAVGCLSKQALVPQSYSIDPPAPRSGASASDARIVSLGRVDVAPVYAGRSFVYRVGEHGIERDPYASFAAPPGWMLSSAIRGYLRDADFVKDVVAPGEGVPPVVAIEVYASELCGDLSNPADLSALLSLQFRVLVPSGRAPATGTFLRTYAQRVRLSQRTAAATADAWNQALALIMKQFLADLKPVLARP